MKQNKLSGWEIIYPVYSIDNLTSLKRESLKIHFSSRKYCRRSTPEVESLIQQRKEKMLSQLPSSIYPGTKFRLDSIERDGSLVVLKVGLTDYFEYLCTNHDDTLNQELVRLGIREFGNPDAFLSNALGNVALVRTVDNMLVVLLRSTSVATFSGYYDLPGGHPEPDEAGCSFEIEAGTVSSRICDELYTSIVRETTEELNINKAQVIKVDLLGLIRSFEDGRKPEMIFYLPVNLTQAELEYLYKQRRVESNESLELVALNPSKMTISEHSMTAPTRAALALFRTMRTEDL